MTPRRCLTLALFVLAGLAGCTRALELSKDDSPTVLAQQTITAPDPADSGTYKVLHMYYGSGTDKQRAIFRDSVAYKTKSVDVSPFVTVQPTAVKDRKKFWGFDMKQVPINARVWYPDGPGPFPLVLVVHGNHTPKDYSDPGYDYLGNLLASRGFILASIDENFINGLSGENDGRAWLLLKHLQSWQRFNDSAGPMQHRVDMQRIALMGHSRGGEAAPLAATFNKLQYYPDDAKQKFDFHFNIRSVVSIAPVDAQYKPAGQFTPLENVNYLVIHGSHDGDVSTFMGLRQYERLRFTDGQPHFKAAMYMYRANHGQWNTVWQNKDNGPRSGRFLDLRGLVPMQDQLRFGKLAISAFLEATLHDKHEYLPFFRDHRTAGHWLPKTMYVTRFQESGYAPLAEYDEDVDLTTGTARGVTLLGDSLSTWKEGILPFRGRGGDDQRHGAVWLGWNNHIRGSDTTKLGRPASYTITLSDSMRAARSPNAASVLYLSLAGTNDKPGPRSPRDTTKADTSKAGRARADSVKKAVADSIKRAPKPPKKPVKDTIPIAITVELVDAGGHTARLPLGNFGTIRRPLEARVYRREGRDEQRFSTIYEVVPQTFVLPLADFVAQSPAFVPGELKTVRLLFDRTPAATVIVSDVGLSTTIDPAFLATPVR